MHGSVRVGATGTVACKRWRVCVGIGVILLPQPLFDGFDASLAEGGDFFENAVGVGQAQVVGGLDHAFEEHAPGHGFTNARQFAQFAEEWVEVFLQLVEKRNVSCDDKLVEDFEELWSEACEEDAGRGIGKDGFGGNLPGLDDVEGLAQGECQVVALPFEYQQGVEAAQSLADDLIGQHLYPGCKFCLSVFSRLAARV